MSQYDILDNLILETLEEGRKRSMKYSGPVMRVELSRLSKFTGRDDDRIKDGRLSALKAKGKIEYVRGANYGWQLKQKVGI